MPDSLAVEAGEETEEGGDGKGAFGSMKVIQLWDDQ
jgi:hypothetical protein